MTKEDKLLDKLHNPKSTMTWGEVVTLLTRLGYKMLNGSGSRRKFLHENGGMISVHEPHPDKNIKPYVKRYVLEQISISGDQL